MRRLMNTNALIMCNRRTISETITGPATEALERSLKRPRTEKSNICHTTYDTTFSFPDLYTNLLDTVDQSDEGFPSISWNSDDDRDTEDCEYPLNNYLHPSTQSFLKCPELSNTLRRSKSFRTNLADMTERPPTINTFMVVESNLRPIRVEDSDKATSLFAKTSSVSRGVELNSLAQVFLSKFEHQDCVDRLQHSLELNVL